MTTNLRGFTLIELLVVVSIIGFIASTVLASLSAARMKGRDAKRLEEMKQIQTALELYFNTNNAYPGSNDQWFDINGCDAGFSDLSSVLTSSYMRKVPTDPTAGRCNWYQNKKSGMGYIVTFQPEQSALLTKDVDCYTPATWFCMGVNWQ